MNLSANSILSYFSFAAGITVGMVLLEPIADQVQAAISKN
tara:strand:- start:169 stop:288 length:120 start_codon:yes stop_codon:yes gene_type:complete